MRVVLAPYTGDPQAIEAVFSVADWLVQRGHEPVLVAGDAHHPFDRLTHVPIEDIGDPGLAISFGGDGTILRTVRLLGRKCPPILGINFGRLGFLTGAQSADFLPAVEAAVEGRAHRERRAKVLLTVYSGDKEIGQFEALNEVVISRPPSEAVLSTQVEVNQHKLYTLSGDGIIIASATGSTAYALSAGGPVVSPGYGGMVVVPLASHSLTQRAIVTAPDDTVRVSFPDPKRSKPVVTADGMEVFPSACGGGPEISHVTVRVSDHSIELVKMDRRLFYTTVAEEFFGGGK